jgi:hypothetical protein
VIRWGWLLAAAILGLGPAIDRTVITTEGKVHVGTVTREGATVVVAAPSGILRIPAGRVVAVFATSAQAREIAASRLEEAKRLFEEAGSMAERDPLRRHKLSVSLDICKETRDLIEVLERGPLSSERGSLAGVMRQIPQLMRLLRDAMGSSAIGETHSEFPGGRVSLERLEVGLRDPDDPPRPGEITADLGLGQVTTARNLGSKDQGAREAAAKALFSPPAPHARAALLTAMSKESVPEILAAIVEAAGRLDLEPHLRTDLAWAIQDDDSTRRLAVFRLLRLVGTRPACDILGECFRGSPPNDHKTRAGFASAFRRMRPGSLEVLRDALIKSKDRRVQVEAVRQLGILRDRAAAPVLKFALTAAATGALPREIVAASVSAFEALGKPAFPVLLDALGDGNEEVRRHARTLVHRVSGESLEGASEATKWWQRNRRIVDEEDAKFWKDQEAKDFPVSPDEFRIYERR